MQTPLLKELNEELDTLGDLCKLVSDSIKEDPPIAMKEGRHYQRRLQCRSGQTPQRQI